MMRDIYTLLNGTFNVYTMDHRGTGRSTWLDCPTTEATTAGSPGGESITIKELPDCLVNVAEVYGNNSISFSVTSAATDLKQVIDHESPNGEVYVYGVSYGTYLVERLMHLNPPSVRGYILDSIQSEVFWTYKDAPYFSNWDKDMGDIGM